MLPHAPIHQAKANSDEYAERICDPVTHVCAAVEGRLYELNYATKGAGTNEDRDQPEPGRCGPVERQEPRRQ